jgi:hypothetical protein
MKHLPGPDNPVRFVHRIAGLGSLGRQRFLALSHSIGGNIAREAKAALPSAYGWATKARTEKLFCEAILQRSVRATDPFLEIDKGWILRRLGPHCSRIELSDFPRRRDELRILHAMGHETANVHFGTPSAISAIKRDLKRRGNRWLLESAKVMADAMLEDWKTWRRASPGDPADGRV